MNYASGISRSSKELVQEDIHLGVASVTNALEACTTEGSLRDVGSASASTTCAENTVRLHELCESCTLFTHRVAALSWFDDSAPHPDWLPQERYRLCALAHLRRWNGRCHFCTILYYFVSRLHSFDELEKRYKSWLYICAWSYCTPWEHGSVRLYATIDRSMWLENNSYSPSFSSWLKNFDLCLLADQGAGGHTGALATATHVPLRSRDNTGLVREWIEDCSRNHTICRAAHEKSTTLRTKPERMLAIDDDRVRLVCNWAQSSGSKYLALSHMWGTDPKQQLRLVLSRIEEFQEDISWTELPLIFKEAIRITRRIGYSYIWIDSLCIIQDSPSDWANEAGKMADVYGQADCTIAYLLPPQDALTKPRKDPKVWSRCIFRRPSLAVRGLYIRPDIEEEIVRNNWHDSSDPGVDWLSPRDWPLFTRAWVCQEYLLSPRIVFAGHRNLMWECSKLLCDELLGPVEEFPKATASKTHFSAVRAVKLPISTLAVQLEFVQNWGRLIRHYRTGVLTQPKDRIMAFAGIAQAIHDSSGMTYLAGCWAQMFPFSFTWNVATPSANITTKEVEAVVEVVPSWSWFSLPVFSNDVLEFQCVDRMLHAPDLAGIGKIEPIYQATLLSFEDRSRQAYADLSPTKSFYSFTGMTLNLAMKSCNGFLEYSDNSSHPCGRSIRDQFDMLLAPHGCFLECQFDHQDMMRNHSDRMMTFGLLIEIRGGYVPNHGIHEEPFLVGLLMQPEPSGEAYKRIGLWTLYLYRHPVEWDGKNFDSVSIFGQLEGVRSQHIRLI